jgi:hypothetical protein
MNYVTDQEQADELELYLDNTSELYDRKKECIREQLKCKCRGACLACQKRWTRLALIASHRYQREIDSKQRFTKAAIALVVESETKGEQVEIELGNWNGLLS